MTEYKLITQSNIMYAILYFVVEYGLKISLGRHTTPSTPGLKY
jgi:hypothetical protein